MRKLIVLLLSCLILSSCGKNINHKKVSQVDQVKKIKLSEHKDLKKISKSVSCQEIMVEKMSGDILLTDTEEKFDNENSTINDIIKNGKKESKYKLYVNDDNLIKSMEVSVTITLGEKKLIVQKTLAYDESRLYFNLQADLYIEGIPATQVVQTFQIDDKCSMQLNIQEIVTMTRLIGVNKFVSYQHVPKTNDVERVSVDISNIPDVWDIDLSELKVTLKDINKKDFISFASNDGGWTETIKVEKQAKEKISSFDPVSKKEAKFDVDQFDIIIGKDYKCQVLIKSSQISSYVSINNTCVNKEYINRLSFEEWKKNKIEVFKDNLNQEVIGFDGNETFETPVKFKFITNQEIGGVPNLDMYLDILEVPSGKEKGELTFIFQTKGVMDLSDVVDMGSPVSEEDQPYLKETIYLNVNDLEVKKIAKKILDQKPKDRLDATELVLKEVSKLITYDQEMIKYIGINRSLTTRDILKRKKGVCHHFANLATTIARAVGIPAKLIGGFTIDKNGIYPHAWIEVKLNNGIWWTPLEPQTERGEDVEIGILRGIYFPTREMTEYEDRNMDNLDILNELLFTQYLRVEKL